MVAAFGLFDLGEVRLQLVFLEEGRAVEPLELAVGRVPLPIRAGDRQQLERLDPAGVGNVRAAAQVDEFALPIEADGRMLGQPGVDVLDLQLLAQPFAEFAGLFAIENEPLERLGILDDLPHLFFDPRKILLADFVRAVDVVIKAVGERGPEGQVDLGKEPHHGPRHDVGTRVSKHAERLGIAIGEQRQVDRLRDVGHFFERPGAVDDGAVCLGRQHGLSEPRADTVGDVEAGTVVRKFLDRTVGQANRNHESKILESPLPVSASTNGGTRAWDGPAGI